MTDRVDIEALAAEYEARKLDEEGSEAFTFAGVPAPSPKARSTLEEIFGEGGPPALSPCAKCGEPSLLRLCGSCAELGPDAAPAPKIFPAYFDRVSVDDPKWLCAHAKPIPTKHWANAVECAHALAESRGSVVLLIGPSGEGKTVLAIAAGRIVEARAGGRRRALPVWTTAIGLEQARMAHPLGMGEAPLVTRAKRAPLLILDDLGQDTSTGGAVVEVIMDRYNAGRRTWVTTGLDAASRVGTYPELERRYGAGVRRRLTDRAHARVVRFGEVIP